MRLSERKLTDGELKKRDEIVTAIKRDRKEENLTHGKPGSVAKRLANQIVVGKVKQALRKKGVK
jgi:hypothetical protein